MQLEQIQKLLVDTRKIKEMENSRLALLLLFMCREKRYVSVTIALVLISKASVFKTKIKKWHFLFIKSYQFCLVFMVYVNYVLDLM